MLIHDQECATELRRKRKRGLVPARADRAFINERVCEGCGDCGRRSHCLSLLPVETEFGAKTRIQQGSCNQDFSCYEGDCPSFLSVIPGNDVAPQRSPKPPADLPLPATQRREARLRLVGIGGTGVVTAAQVLAMAALQDGKRTIGADQTGLAQKGGPVVSDVTIVSTGTLDRAPGATAASVDAYLVFDILGAVASRTIEVCDPGRTVAVISTSQTPPAAMVGNPDVTFPAIDGLVARIAQRTAADRNMRLDAHALAEALCGDDLMANSLLMGAAWQAGLIPIALPAMEKAFRLNGVAVERNLEAFAWGRAVVARPEAVAQAGVSETELPPRLEGGLAEIASLVGAPPGSELHRLTAIRVAELAAYKSRRYARRYAEAIADVARREQAATGGSEVAQAVARNLYKLMAYKDEYEVARLHLLPSERARVERELGEGARVRVMLHPPVLRALGLKRKIRLGRGAGPLFRALRAMRRLRGTPLDVFGYAEVRRVERRLIPRYEELVGRALDALPARPDVALALCELPDMVRGYEHVKLRNVERFEARAAELLASLSTVHAAKEEGQP
jgi:indolepyruvate ferredoxin oxidoreductase